MIQLLIADDHKVLLDGFCSIIDSIEDISIVQTATNGSEAIEYLRKHPEIDIALLDINMPEMNGIEACKMISKSIPKVKVIALSMYNKHSYINRMIKNGAMGYVLKNAGAIEIEKAIRRVYAGERYLSQAVLDTLMGGETAPTDKHQIPPLTKREQEVLELIALEFTTKEIAKKLFVSFDTIQTHRKHLIQKFNSKNIVGVITRATDMGLL